MRHHVWPYIATFFGGGLGNAVLSYALQNFPVKDNKWVNWTIGIIQVAIGLKERGVNTFQGVNTLPVAVPPADAVTTKNMQAAAGSAAAMVGAKAEWIQQGQGQGNR